MYQKYDKEKVIRFLFYVCYQRTIIQSDESNNIPIGLIICINARELHIRNPHFYKDIYVKSAQRVDKDLGAMTIYTVSRASFATVDHDLYRVRCSLMNPYFFKRLIVSLEPIIHEKISRLYMSLEESIYQVRVVNLDSAFAELMADIVTCYFYGSQFNYLGSKNFGYALRNVILGVIKFYYLT